MPPRAASNDADLLTMVGRLLEGTKYTAEALKAVTEEGRQTAASAQAAQQALASQQRTVEEIDRILRSGNGDSLVTIVRIMSGDIKRLTDEVDQLTDKVDGHAGKLDVVDKDRASVVGGHKVLLMVGVALAWLVTTAVAIYAAIGQWMGGSK